MDQFAVIPEIADEDLVEVCPRDRFPGEFFSGQGDIRLACLQSGPRRTLDIIDADEVFRTYETRGEAARSYQDDLDLSNGA